MQKDKKLGEAQIKIQFNGDGAKMPRLTNS